jgi:hypothetical protein
MHWVNEKLKEKRQTINSSDASSDRSSISLSAREYPVDIIKQVLGYTMSLIRLSLLQFQLQPAKRSQVERFVKAISEFETPSKATQRVENRMATCNLTALISLESCTACNERIEDSCYVICGSIRNTVSHPACLLCPFCDKGGGYDYGGELSKSRSPDRLLCRFCGLAASKYTITVVPKLNQLISLLYIDLFKVVLSGKEISE